MWAWLRRSFVTGLFVMVPLVASVIALVWVFRIADRLTSGVPERVFGRYTPGLGIALTAVLVLGVGSIATNMFGRRVLQRGEALLLQVPVFRTVYAPLKQLMAAFSPDNESGFKRVVLVQQSKGRYALGFLTREFVVDRHDGKEELLAVYVPTNHLYLGDVVICPRDRVTFPDLTVEQGIRIFLTGGVALPPTVRTQDE
jgi:uncharacterized membrane protein